MIDTGVSVYAGLECYSKEENIYAYLYNSSTFVVFVPQPDYNAYNIKHMIEDQGISLSTTRGLVPNVAVYYFDIYNGPSDQISFNPYSLSL